MAKYEVWGRKAIGKGKRRKLAYGLCSENEAKTKRQELIDQGYSDCVCVRTQPAYDAGGGIARRQSREWRESLKSARKQLLKSPSNVSSNEE